MTLRHKLGLFFATALCLGVPPSADTPVETDAAIDGPGVVLTFDDAHVEQWVAALPLFAKYGAHATFFVTQFDKLSDKQVEGLHTLKQAGHAIGCHGLRHRKAAEYVREHGAEKYLADEIEPALALMVTAGFAPTCFAYPMSDRSNESDAALLQHFRHLRGGAFPAAGQPLVQLDALFTPLDGVATRGCLLGTSLDRAGEEGREHVQDEVKEALLRSKESKECVVFYSHCIGTEPRNHITLAALESILACAHELGLVFYTYDDLP